MIPASRAYLHLPCQSTTEISNGEFHALSDPLLGMQRTYCVGCNEVFSLDEFVWADTKERIPEYYARYAQRVSPLGRWLGSRAGLFVLTGVGALLGLLPGLVILITVGWLAGLFAALAGLLLGVIAGFAIPEFMLKPITIRRALGVTDTRMLR